MSNYLICFDLRLAKFMGAIGLGILRNFACTHKKKVFGKDAFLPLLHPHVLGPSSAPFLALDFTTVTKEEEEQQSLVPKPWGLKAA